MNVTSHDISQQRSRSSTRITALEVKLYKADKCNLSAESVEPANSTLRIVKVSQCPTILGRRRALPRHARDRASILEDGLRAVWKKNKIAMCESGRHPGSSRSWPMFSVPAPMLPNKKQLRQSSRLGGSSPTLPQCLGVFPAAEQAHSTPARTFSAHPYTGPRVVTSPSVS